MRLTQLFLSNFRGSRELQIHFEPDVTVIVGRNGAGKSSILDALAMTIGLARSHSRGIDQTATNIRRHSQDIRRGEDSAKLEVEYEVRDQETGVSISNILAVRIDSYGSPPDFRSLIDKEALATLVSSPPWFIYYRQERGFTSTGEAETRESSAELFDPEIVQDRSLQMDFQAISDLAAWWDQRDAQEARRVRDGERGYRDSQLEAIRELIARIDGFSHLYFDATAAPPGLHLVKSDGTRVHVSSLSAGERSYIVLLADLARRLQVFAPDKPLDEIPAVVLIDEVELNLHPGWQSEMVPTLTEVFRTCQFIVTTHSPQVLSGVKSEKVRIIEEDVPDWSWKVTIPLSTRGRTSNYLLEGVLGARERFPPLDEMIGTFNAAIDRRDAAAAAETLENLEQEIGDDAPTLVVLRKRLKNLRGSG